MCLIGVENLNFVKGEENGKLLDEGFPDFTRDKVSVPVMGAKIGHWDDNIDNCHSKGKPKCPTCS